MNHLRDILVRVIDTVFLPSKISDHEAKIDADNLIDVRNDVTHLLKLLFHKHSDVASGILGFNARDRWSSLEHVAETGDIDEKHAVFTWITFLHTFTSSTLTPLTACERSGS